MREKQFAIGIDLGGTNCRAALVSRSGELGPARRMATRIDKGLADFLQRLEALVADLLGEARQLGQPVEVIGLGAPGVIAGDGSVVVSPNLSPLDGQPLALTLTERFSLPVTVLNDANAIAWGEAQAGAGRELESFIAITLGTGVGGGLIINRRVWLGADGAAGEVGHLTIEPQGRPCACGSRGCLEQYASASAMVASARELLPRSKGSLLGSVAEGELTSARIAEAARRRDRVALAALEIAGRSLGQALAGIANLLNLEGAVITGGASECLDLLRPTMEREIAARAFAIPARRLRILRGTLGDDAGILGAALHGLARIA
ncbi:sugar kinase [Desulfuromonas versatilis]|uniref:Sugar kinase n=1 Tax=Desulfuromonas versatilis TaxID=2802975 RepID=A0ABN6DXD8_9BACT|nr:ROK family protein [Desulfuromonas versatilis]BCR04803.1 sugar kinase [Desulfuromonas versatilis]